MKPNPLFAEGLATLVRPRYSPGLLLEDEDLTAGVDYTRELNRLLFRSLFGCGVICGLKVEVAPECNNRILAITIGSGLALDCMGNPVHVPSEQVIRFDPGCDDFPNEIWVTACYSEQPCRPRDVSCGCDDGGGPPQVERTRIRAGFEIRVSKDFPLCACSCEEPPPPSAKPGSRCCPNPAEKTAEGRDNQALAKDEEGEEALTSKRDCYADHMEGICACDCGCDCVMIAKLIKTTSTEKPNDPHSADGYSVQTENVRLIRPVLIGQQPRRQSAQAKAIAEEAAKKPGNTDA